MNKKIYRYITIILYILYSVLLYQIILYYIILYYAILCWYCIISYYVVLYYIISYHIIGIARKSLEHCCMPFPNSLHRKDLQYSSPNPYIYVHIYHILLILSYIDTAWCSSTCGNWPICLLACLFAKLLFLGPCLQSRNLASCSLSSPEKSNHWSRTAKKQPVGGFNPAEKYYSSKIGSFPQIGVKIKNIGNHHLELKLKLKIVSAKVTSRSWNGVLNCFRRKIFFLQKSSHWALTNNSPQKCFKWSHPLTPKYRT